MASVFASAADERYGFHLLSMLGSLQRNSDVFDAIVVHDLGLSRQQRRLLDGIRGVEVRTVPPFVPHWAQGFTWKPWIWTHLEAERVFWLDAGAMVLRSLGPVLEQVGERGYWVVSQGHPARALLPDDWYELYGLDRQAAERSSVAAGIIGFETRGRFWDDVVVPTYEDCLAGRSLGFSEQDADSLNYGLGRTTEIVIRDAPLFRWDQSVLNAHFLKSFPEAVIADVYQYAGWTSPNDHPEQVIWSHRRRGDYRHLAHACYTPWAKILAVLVALRLRTRFLRPAAYVRKARTMLTRRRS